MVQGVYQQEAARDLGLTMVMSSVAQLIISFGRVGDAWEAVAPLGKLRLSGRVDEESVILVRTDQSFDQWSQALPSLGASIHGMAPRKSSTSQEQDRKPLALSNATGTCKASSGLYMAVGTVSAGAFARTIAQAAIHPLDTVKTRMQVAVPLPQLVEWQQLVSGSRRHISILNSRLTVCNFLKGGLRDLYRGLSAAVCATLPTAFTFFATDEACKQLLERHFGRDRREMVTHIISSSAAAFTSAFIKVPGDVIKHRVQAYAYPSVIQAAQHIYKYHGLKGLYCGFGATLMRDVPEMAIQFTVYQQLRKAFDNNTNGATNSSSSNSSASPQAWLQHLLLGGAAGAVASTITTPLDVIKTQLQCDGVKSAGTALRQVLGKRGPMGLVAGLGPRVLQTTLMSAIFFTCYEAFKQHLAAAQAPILAGAGAAVVASSAQSEQVAPLLGGSEAMGSLSYTPNQQKMSEAAESARSLKKDQQMQSVLQGDEGEMAARAALMTAAEDAYWSKPGAVVRNSILLACLPLEL